MNEIQKSKIRARIDELMKERSRYRAHVQRTNDLIEENLRFQKMINEMEGSKTHIYRMDTHRQCLACNLGYIQKEEENIGTSCPRCGSFRTLAIRADLRRTEL